jgi:hypothetical protein
MSKAIPSPVFAALLASLSACSGGGGNDSYGSVGPINCAGLTGATATGNVACTAGECGVTFHDAAIDGDLNTYAILAMGTGAGGSISLRSSAQDGVTYAAGTPAAVVYGIERNGNSTSTLVNISTYLDGALQESGNTSGQSVVDGFDHEPGRHAMGTTLPFDAIELTYVQSGSSGPIEMRVHEFCTSTN